MKVRVKKLDERAVIPEYSKPGDAGMDLTAISVEDTSKYIEYDTKLVFEIPEGYVGLLFPRSSISKRDLILANSVGVVDSSYRGSIKFRFKKTEDNVMFCDRYKAMERVGQIMIISYPKIEIVESEELSDTERGSKGFGHTGK
jgi:dUTP pyrophosphatase